MMTFDPRFEIGRTKKIRDQYERGCECVQTSYGLLDGGALSVNNTCLKDDKNFVYILGTAKPRSASQFKLTVQVTGPNADIATFFMNLVPGNNYVIKNVWYDSNGDYTVALVASDRFKWIPDWLVKSNDAIWILARTPSISQAEIEEALAYATAAGLDPVSSEWLPSDQVKCRSKLPSQ
jgi:lipocalin